MTTIILDLVPYLHDDSDDYCLCSVCAVARVVVEGMTGIVLDNSPGHFVLDEVPLPL